MRKGNEGRVQEGAAHRRGGRPPTPITAGGLFGKKYKKYRIGKEEIQWMEIGLVHNILRIFVMSVGKGRM